jgi:hypothetical protein
MSVENRTGWTADIPDSEVVGKTPHPGSGVHVCRKPTKSPSKSSAPPDKTGEDPMKMRTLDYVKRTTSYSGNPSGTGFLSVTEITASPLKE